MRPFRHPPGATTPVTAPHLAAQQLVVARSGRRVLNGVDVDFARGRVTAVVGPSGAGKTTLLRALNRLDEPTAGRVVFHGRDVRALDPCQLRRRVAMVFQTPVVLPGTVRANLAYGLDDPGEEALVQALVDVGLPGEALQRDAHTLSTGEAQRMTIARALVREPEVLLADEPTGALDRDASAGIEALIGRLCVERGLTVAFVTHDLAQAERMAERAVLLSRGRIVAADTPAEVAASWPGVVT